MALSLTITRPGTVDAGGVVVGPARLFSLNPAENTGDHNYTGYPTYNGGETDRLFTSGSDYTYSTAISSCVVTTPPGVILRMEWLPVSAT